MSRTIKKKLDQKKDRNTKLEKDRKIAMKVKSWKRIDFEDD